MDSIIFNLPNQLNFPTIWEYFWFNFNFASINLVSFLIGFILSIITFFAFLKKAKEPLILSFSIFIFSYSIHSLLIFFRGVILDNELLLILYRFFFPFTILSCLSLIKIVDILSFKKYKLLNILNYCLAPFLLGIFVYLLLGNGFLNEFVTNDFGKIPKIDKLLIFYELVISILISILLYLIYRDNYREKEKNHPLFGILVLFSITFLMDFFSYLNFNLLSFGNFYIIPMFYSLYLVVKKDILGLSDFFKNKNILFYVFLLILFFIFLCISLLLIYFLPDEFYQKISENMYYIFSLFSAFSIFLFIIYIIGNNPSDRITVLSSIALLGNALFSLILLVNSFHIDPIVNNRIEQFLYLFIAATPMVQWRLSFLLMDKPKSKITHIVDIFSIISFFLALTPFFFIGYFDYSFGRYSKGGFGLFLISTAALLALFEVSRNWFIERKLKKDNQRDLILLSFLLSGLMMLSGLPASIGYPVYSLANFQFISSMILGLAIIKFDTFRIKGEVSEISRKFIFLLNILIFSFFIKNLYDLRVDESFDFLVNKLILSYVFIYLTFFTLLFILIKPISRKLYDFINETTKQKRELENIKFEMDKVNLFSKKLNSNIDLDEIIDLIFKYFKNNFQMDFLWLLLFDKPKKEIYTYKFAETFSDEIQIEFLKNFRIRLKESFSFSLSFLRKEIVYVESLNENLEFARPIDKQISDVLNFHSYMHVPLKMNREIIGILAIPVYEHNKPITQNKIDSISIFTEQIVSAIRNSKMIQELNNSKIQNEQSETQLINNKKELEALIELSKLINSTSDFDSIMHYIYNHMQSNYGIEAFWLLGVNEEDNILYTMYSENNIIDEYTHEYYRNIKIPINKNAGGFYFTYKKQENLLWEYSPRFDKMINSAKTLDMEIIRNLKLKVLINIPMVLQNKTIGILSLTSYKDDFHITKEILQKLSNFSEQITGTIYNSKLLNETKKAKVEMELQKSIVENKNLEIENLNILIKSLNEELDLKVIMKKINKYIKSNYNIDYYALYLVNNDSKYLQVVDMSEPEGITKTVIQNIYDFKMTLENSRGGHGLAFNAKKPFYLPKVKKWGITQEESYCIDSLQIDSFLILPLVLQNETIGFLDLFHSEKLNLDKSTIKKLFSLTEQFAGIIYSSNLFNQIKEERRKSEKLLLNILPEDVAIELKYKGATEPISYECVSVLFTDFKGFTKIAEKLPPQELIKELDACFTQFDNITDRYKLEKLKTIGDSYMAAGGIPKITPSLIPGSKNAIDIVLAALEIQSFMNQMKEIKEMLGFPYWELRLGIHSGPLIAGVIGEKKFAYDVWGDTVNTASRMESSGTPGKINISGATYDLVKDFFDCEYRGMVSAKNKGAIEMYYVNSIKKEYDKSSSNIPNEKFWEKYNQL
jgi:class 3 adenylate cyclase